jgi:hypothetical protein
MKLTRALHAATAAALAISLAAPMVVLADPGTDSVRAHGMLQLIWDVDLSAKSTATGLGASGRATFSVTTFDPDATFRGEVTCLRVVGATATTFATFYAVARVTDAPPGSTSQSIHVFGTDSGKFANAPDTLEAFDSPAPPSPDGSCPTSFPFASRPLADGEVVINNTLP